MDIEVCRLLQARLITGVLKETARGWNVNGQNRRSKWMMPGCHGNILHSLGNKVIARAILWNICYTV